MTVAAENGMELSVDVMEAIRRFYLQPVEFYSLGDLVTVWRVSLDDVCAMFADELAATERDEADAASFRVTWAMAVGVASVFHVFRAVEVERALEEDFNRVRSDRWRTVRIEVHVPKFVADGIARLEIVPEPGTLAARAERLLCEYVEAEYLTRSAFRDAAN